MLKLDDSTLAPLLRAAIMYGYAGEAPSFDGINAVVWAMIKDKLDRDSAAYEERCRKARWSRYKGVQEKSGHAALSYEDWAESIDQRQPTSTNVDDSDETETEPKTEPKTETHTETQVEAKGAGGNRLGELFENAGFPKPYQPLTEDDFERQREAQLAKLGVSW